MRRVKIKMQKKRELKKKRESKMRKEQEELIQFIEEYEEYKKKREEEREVAVLLQDYINNFDNLDPNSKIQVSAMMKKNRHVFVNIPEDDEYYSLVPQINKILNYEP